ncbi:Ger(x)C family spore germination protein [Paenibacillus sp. J2TS4]|uniref:Ger(x)C family spore germination protein n=1 Tax=Paenibacillus sp. J2TS4 TaxID=2807194 RepID=UPI001BD0D2A1|nr:Ger(x)C family spore germination protein [Paenibacillus sp. J2TS4]
MMKLQWRFLLGFILLSLLLTGCWSRRELNDLAIQVAVGIDKSDDLFHLTAQVVEPGEVAKKDSSGARSPVTTYSATGRSLIETYRKMTTTSPRRIYGAHLRMIVLSEEVAREGLNKVMDLFSRDHEFRTDFYVVVAKNTKAENILKIITPLEKIPANRLLNSLETSEKYWAPVLGISLHELINDIVSDGRQPVLTALELKGDLEVGKTEQNVKEIAPEAILHYVGLAIFKQDKLIGWFDEENSKGVTYLRNKVKNTIGVLPCLDKEGEINIEVARSNAKIKPELKDGAPQIHVELKVEANISEVSCSIDLTQRSTLTKLERLMEHHLEKMIRSSVRQAQKMKSDVFGFGEEFHRSEPEYWATVKNNWNQIFAKMPVQLKVEVKVRHSGTIGNPIMKKSKG